MRFTKQFLPLAIGLAVASASLPALAGGPDYPQQVTPGVYMGVGGTLNLEYMSVNTASSFFDTTTGAQIATTANIKDKQIDGAPMAQLGYWGMLGQRSLWGIVGEYKYLNYTFNTINGTNPIAFPNLASLPGYGDLSVNLQHEFMLLMYLGATYRSGYFYVGLGPVLFTLRDSIRNYVSLDQGNNFQGTNNSDTIWGGAAQLGYNYYFDPTWFIGFNYTYTVTGNYALNNNTKNWQYYYYAAQTDAQGTTYVADIANADVNFNRNYSFTVQEFMFSLNKVFAV